MKKRKLAALILSTALFAATIPLSAVYGEAAPLSIGFENESDFSISNTRPELMSYELAGGIGEKQENDKALKLSSKQTDETTGYKALTASVPVSKNYGNNITTAFQFYTNLTSRTGSAQMPTLEVSLKDVSGKSARLIYVKKTQVVAGTKWTSITSGNSFENQWNTYAVSIDMTTNIAAFYLNGVKAATLDTLLPENFSAPASVEFSLNYWYDAPGENCFAAVDNLELYSGTYKNAVSDYELSYTANIDSSLFKTTTVYGFGGKSLNDEALKITALKTTNQSGSKELGITFNTADMGDTATFETEFYSNLSNNPSAKENQRPWAEIMLSDGTNSIRGLYAKNNSMQSGNWKAVLSGNPEENKWNKLAVTLDKTAATPKLSIYLNGALMLTLTDEASVPASYGKTKSITLALKYWYDAPGDDCFIIFDNLKYYGGTYKNDGAVTLSNSGSKMYIKGFKNVSEVLSNVIYRDGFALSIKDSSGNPVPQNAEVKPGMKVLASSEEEAKEYVVSNLNQIFYDDFDGWSNNVYTNINGAAENNWYLWKSSENDETKRQMYAESEDGRGKVLKIYTAKLSEETEALNVFPMFYPDQTKITAGKTILVSFDVKSDSLTGETGFVCKNDLPSNTFIRFGLLQNGRNIKTEGINIGNFDTNRWYNITSVFDTSKGTFKTYIDGVLISDITKAELAYSELKINHFRFEHQASYLSERCSSFDNLEVYAFDSPNEFSLSGRTTTLESNSENIKISDAGLTHALYVPENTTARALSDALSSENNAVISVSGEKDSYVTPETIITVVSADGSRRALYNVANKSGVAALRFEQNSAPIQENPSGWVSITADIADFGEGIPAADIIIAAYKGNRLLSIDVKRASDFSDNPEAFESFKIHPYANLLLPEEWTELKGFLLSSTENISPLGKSISIIK